MKNCLNCKKHKQLVDEQRHCFVHKCREYRQYTVFGTLEGVINPDCMVFEPIKTKRTKDMSLREKTLYRAGGTYDITSEMNRSGIKDYKGK